MRSALTTKETGFQPAFTITSAIARGLMRIEAVKHAIEALPITPRVLANLRETARLYSTHYSMSGVNYSSRLTTTIIPDSCWNFFLSSPC
jgi:hypothetical protein